MCGNYTGHHCFEARASVPKNNAPLICRGVYITFKDEMGQGSGVMKVPSLAACLPVPFFLPVPSFLPFACVSLESASALFTPACMSTSTQ